MATMINSFTNKSDKFSIQTNSIGTCYIWQGEGMPQSVTLSLASTSRHQVLQEQLLVGRHKLMSKRYPQVIPAHLRMVYHHG